MMAQISRLLTASGAVFGRARKVNNSDSASHDTVDIYGDIVKAIDLVTYPPAEYGVPVVAINELLGPHGPLLELIKRSAKLPDSSTDKNAPSFETLYLEVATNYAAFAHSLPASEGHHHNRPGGLLKHSLDVAEKALRWAEDNYLPAQFPSDIEFRRKPRWRYAAWLCGLLHDAGKLYTDMVVFDAANKGDEWKPVTGSLVDWAKRNGVKRYKVEWLASRIHKQHETAGAHILPHVLTDAARQYIASCPGELYTEISNVLSGYQTSRGFLESAVRQADSVSTSQDMVTIWDTELGKRQSSTYERILKGIQILHPKWKVNTTNANIWTIGDDVYLRWPDAFAATVNYLTEQQVSVPQSPETIVTLLNDRGVLQNIDKKEKYVLFAPGEFTKDDAQAIYEGKKKVAWQYLIRAAWPGLVYGGAPIPMSQQGLMKINHDFDAILYRQDGSITRFSKEDFTTQADEPKKTSRAKKKPKSSKAAKQTQAPSESNSEMPNESNNVLRFNAEELDSINAPNNGDEEPLAPASNNGSAKPTTNDIPHDQVSTNVEGEQSMPPTEDSPPLDAYEDLPPSDEEPQHSNTTFTGTVSPAANTPKQATANSVNELIKSRTKPVSTKYPWKESVRSPGKIDEALAGLCEQLTQGTIAKENVESLMRIEPSVVIVEAHKLSELVNIDINELVQDLKMNKLIEFDASKPRQLTRTYKLPRSKSVAALTLSPKLSQALTLAAGLKLLDSGSTRAVSSPKKKVNNAIDQHQKGEAKKAANTKPSVNTATESQRGAISTTKRESEISSRAELFLQHLMSVHQELISKNKAILVSDGVAVDERTLWRHLTKCGFTLSEARKITQELMLRTERCEIESKPVFWTVLPMKSEDNNE
ncbi:TraI domain-containing protein [Neiella marina]|uniref:TraI domain-containing protein n=1 Tax=Neiella holothuriorum TaxID=2870530 RepID=A0ABS7EHZ9_9GAMM|nr:MobH family relaxase [Neiella holothuriorum]MBW8191381.1 TraI domain-containing protein [Neiella holothuriorum]